MPDEHEKVFHYINQRRYEHEMLDIPVLYLDEISDKCDFWIICPDSDVTFDDYGDPHYSEVYLKRLPDKQSTLKLTRDKFPDTIFEGTLVIGKKAAKFNPFRTPKNDIFTRKIYAVITESQYSEIA